MRHYTVTSEIQLTTCFVSISFLYLSQSVNWFSFYFESLMKIFWTLCLIWGLPQSKSPMSLLSPPRTKTYGDTWADYHHDSDYHTNNGIFALQEKINLLKNHPSEIFNFMVVSGSPRLGKNNFSFIFVLRYLGRSCYL